MTNNPCDVKRLFDTEFEAEIAASKMGFKWGVNMVTYRCGTHWHIANELKTLRSKTRLHDRMYCDVCDTYMKKSRWNTHRTLVGHIRNWEKKKGA